MELNIEKSAIGGSIEFLGKLNLKSKASRHRSKLIRLLTPHFEELAADEKELLLQYAARDEEGEPVTSEDGQSYQIENAKSYLVDRKELFTEKILISGPEHEEMFKTVLEILENCEMELSGPDAYIYDLLLTQLEA